MPRRGDNLATRRWSGARFMAMGLCGSVLGRLKSLPFYLCVLCLFVVGCAGNPATLPETPQLLAQVAKAERRPVELSEAQKQEVLAALAASHGGGAQRFSDPEFNSQVWASFWRSPIDMQTDRNRLLLVRYYEDGTYVYVGFGRDGKLFTDGVGALLADPPWSQ